MAAVTIPKSKSGRWFVELAEKHEHFDFLYLPEIRHDVDRTTLDALIESGKVAHVVSAG